MPIKKNYYEILGVSRTATTEQIKRRYRLLVRKYHPDVAQDKAAAQAAFLQITEAYQTLTNSDRRTIYDASLDLEMFRVERRRPTSTAGPRSTGPTARPRPTPRAAPRDQVIEAQRLVEQAQVAYRRQEFRWAAEACIEAKNLDPRNARAHVILGDIYAAQSRTDDAAAMYTIASQLDPRNTEILSKLNRLAKRRRPGQPAVTPERRAALKMGLNLMGWSMSAFMFAMLLMSPGQPIPWLQQNLAVVGTWSTMLIAVLMVTGGLTGFLMSVNDSVQPLDDELVFQAIPAPGSRPASYPIGLILVLFNLFSFYVAVAVYAIVARMQDRVSKSVVKSFVATFALVLIASVVYVRGGSQVFMFGGNVAFPAVLFGWAIGDMFRPGW